MTAFGRHPVRNTLLAAGGAVVAIGIIGSALGGSKTVPPSAPAPDASSSALSQPSSALAPAQASPSAPAQPPFTAQTLLDISGSGSTSTARYTVGGSGDYDIRWSYSEGSFGESVNFQIYGDGGSDFNVADPNQLGTGGSGVAHVYDDAGTHYLEINSEGDWTIKVVTAP